MHNLLFVLCMINALNQHGIPVCVSTGGSVVSNRFANIRNKLTFNQWWR